MPVADPFEPPGGRWPGTGWSSGGRRLRARVGVLRRGVHEAVQRLDPSRWTLRSLADGTGVAVVGVYRERNAAVVTHLLTGLPPGAVALLWSLDGVPPDLASRTAGCGPGTRLTLVNRLVASLPEGAARRALVVLDDDVRFMVGDLDQLVATGARLGLDLYQPAHTAMSHASFGFVRRRQMCVARDTDFVEQGPVIVLSPLAQGALLPFPEDMGMAWGVEVRWLHAARAAGLRLGIVDAVALRHLSPRGTAYDADEQERVLAAELAAGGFAHLTDLHVERGRTTVFTALTGRLRRGRPRSDVPPR